MSSRDPTGWMWAEACQLLEQADRLHRQFFRLGVSADARTTWEPPVDVFEDENELTIIVALPGVAPERIELALEPRGLVIRAERRLPIDSHGCAIRRLEIPHGYFERRIALPTGRFGQPHREWVNGCLVLIMRKLS